MNEADFAGQAHNDTPYVTGDSIEGIINSLETASIKLFKWFGDNHMKPNKNECHLFVSGSENITINVDYNITGMSICENCLV